VSVISLSIYSVENGVASIATVHRDNDSTPPRIGVHFPATPYHATVHTQNRGVTLSTDLSTDEVSS